MEGLSSRGSAMRRRLASLNLRGRRAASSMLVHRARRSRENQAERPGITIVTVTWNSLPFLEGCLTGVRLFTAPDVEILVVDNRSDDGTREYLAGQSDVRVVRTPWNVGHGFGLDLGMSLAETEMVVTLDVDAFPISESWLSAVIDPLRAGAVIAGAYVQRAFIHPSFLAMRRRDYLEMGVGFAPRGLPTAPGGQPRGVFMDVGEALSHTVAVVHGSASLHRVPITANSGNQLVGSIYGDVVYHNFYSTQGDPNLVRASHHAWSEARAKYLDS